MGMHLIWTFQRKTQVCLYFNGDAWIEAWILLGGGRWRVPRMTQLPYLYGGDDISSQMCCWSHCPSRCQVACSSTHKQVKVHGCVQNLNNCTSKLQTDVRTCRHSLLVYTYIGNKPFAGQFYGLYQCWAVLWIFKEPPVVVIWKKKTNSEQRIAGSSY
jgi:hypothetical protein